MTKYFSLKEIGNVEKLISPFNSDGEIKKIKKIKKIIKFKIKIIFLKIPKKIKSL
jgi:hypothetical protein